jgi:MYXO-CTERM domain-containing protein
LRRTLLVVFLLALAVPATALALTALTSVDSFNFDFLDPDDGFAVGAMSDGTSDAYDTCYQLRVGGSDYLPSGATVSSLGGRQLEFPVQRLASVDVHRIVYVPASDGDYARYLEVFENPGASPVTVSVSVSGNLGSDGSTVLNTTSSGDGSITTMDSWFTTDDFDGSGDPSLAHIFQGASPTVRVSTASLSFDNIEYSWSLTVPAGGRAALMHFAVQERNLMSARTEAERLVEVPDDALAGIDEYLGDIVNFPAFFPCTEPEGAACMTPAGVAGLCRSGSCCTGCWNGTRCQVGTRSNACGIGGGTCTDCADPLFCTLDSCTAGVCSSAPSPTICNDAMGCTMDTCIEATDSCTFTFVGGCIIGGMCVGEGETNPSYPCQICDPDRDATDWSTMPEGTECGGGRICGGGRLRDRACNDSGVCVYTSSTRCATGACSDSTTCAEPCDASACEEGEWCDPTLMRCERIAGLGEECTAPMGCESGMCVDGVCCDAEECDGACTRCDVSGSEGSCTAVPEGEDPDVECPLSTCDGAGMCAPGPDAGPGDAGMFDAGASDAGIDAGGGFDAGAAADAGGTPPPPEDDGCGCSTNGPTGLGAIVPFGVVALWLARRRRRT